MSFSAEKRESMKRYMLEKIRMNDEKYIAKTVENFGISVTSVKRYLKECLSDGILKNSDDSVTGYCLTETEADFSYIRDENKSEDKIYYADILPALNHISAESKNIWAYAFMEMMNNALEHSNAGQIWCHLRQDYLYTEISIMDDGIGIFNKIQRELTERTGQEADYHDAISELYKGKFTTNPASHSGEGIFFTSKVMRTFAIWSEDAIFSSGCYEKDRFVQSHLIKYYTMLNKIGTMVVMRLENHTRRKLREVFDLYATVEDGLVNTRIPIKEVCPHGEPIARSQARRLLYRLEKFKKVEFDFMDIEFMGQGFADEVFRVFQKEHPDIELLPVNANEDILRMVKHVRVNL